MSIPETDPKIGDWASKILENDQASETERNNSRVDTERTESDSNDPATMSEKGDFKFESDDSELESERSQSDYDFERITEDEAAACGDGLAESNIPGYDLPKFKVRRRRSAHNGEPEASLDSSNKEPMKLDQLLMEFPATNNSHADLKKQEQECDNHPGLEVIASKPTTSSASFWDWFVYIVPKAVCLFVLSLIYLGLIMLSIRILSMSAKRA